MTIVNTIDHEQGLINTVCSGDMTSEDFDAYLVRIWSDDSHFGYNELFDTTSANWEQFDFGYLLELSAKAAKLTTIDPKSKLAWVVLEGKQKQLTDFYQAAKSLITTKSRSLEAFNDRKEALQWLGIKEY